MDKMERLAIGERNWEPNCDVWTRNREINYPQPSCGGGINRIRVINSLPDRVLL